MVETVTAESVSTRSTEKTGLHLIWLSSLLENTERAEKALRLPDMRYLHGLTGMA